jgi:protein XagA
MKKLLIIFLSLSVTTALAGGGWPQPKRGGYFKLSQNYIGSSYFFGPDGSISDITTIQLFSTSLYGEYGFTNRLTGIVYFPLFVRNTLNEIQYNQSGTAVPGDAQNALGDTDIAIKYGLIIDKPIVVSGTILFGLPLGKPAGGITQILQTGDGEFNQMIRIDASGSFHPKPVYVSAYAAFNNRTKGFSDEVRFGAEVGFTFKKFIPILKLNVVQSLFNGDASVVQNGIFSNNTEFVSPTIELNYQVTEKIGISGSGGFALTGKNILASPNWGLGLYLKL